MNDYLDCLENAANAECGQPNVGLWIHEFTSRLYQPAFEGEGCEFKDNDFYERPGVTGKQYVLKRPRGLSQLWDACRAVGLDG